MEAAAFEPLVSYLQRIPAMEQHIGYGETDSLWWVKFRIVLDHPLAWHVVQELGHVLNYLSLDERLPTVFMPVSPPPYMNGSPHNFLSWVIECQAMDFTPSDCTEWLEGRLPRPVEKEAEWQEEDGI